METPESIASHYTDTIYDVVVGNARVCNEAVYNTLRLSCPNLIEAICNGDIWQLLNSSVGVELDGVASLMDVDANIDHINSVLLQLVQKAKSASYVSAYEAAEKKYIAQIESMRKEIDDLKEASHR